MKACGVSGGVGRGGWRGEREGSVLI